MLISPHEQEWLLIHVAAGLARERRARGLRLNYPEAVAIITSFLLEGARDGRSVVDLTSAGRAVLTREDVMEGVPEMLTEAGVLDIERISAVRTGCCPHTAIRDDIPSPASTAASPCSR